MRRIDKEFERRIARAVEQGELPATANPRTLAEIASALLHTLAIRSRYGATRKELRRLAEHALVTCCKHSRERRGLPSWGRDRAERPGA